MEPSQLICCANHLTGFYMRATLALNELTKINILILINIFVLKFRND